MSKANLEELWFEQDENQQNMAIRLDWDNDRHSRVALNDITPEHILHGLYRLIELIRADIESKEI